MDWCPVTWKTCTAGCGTHGKREVKRPTSQSYFCSIFQPVPCYPQTFCRLLLLFSGNSEGERGRYYIHLTPGNSLMW